MRFWISCWLAATFCISAQENGIAGRLRQALAGSGKEDQALTALAARDYESVDQILAGQENKASSNTPELLALRGALDFLRGEMKAAVAQFLAASRAGPLSEVDTFTQAMALVQIGPRTEARKLIEQLDRAHPDHPIYIYWLGRLDYDEHRYEQAVQEFQRSLKLNPNLVRAWDSLGLAYDMLGRASEANQAFEKAVTLNRLQSQPSPWPPQNFGYWLLRADKPVEAEAALRESLRYNPNLPDAHYHLGRTLEKQGKIDEAIKQYQQAANLGPSAADACYSLALLYRKQHRDADAAAMFAEYRKRKGINAP